MKDSIKNIAKAGYIAKGVVYLVTGFLALKTAMDLGGKNAGKLEVIVFLEKQTFGKIILAVIGLGLICYALWRFIQSFRDPENIGNDNKAMVKRFSFGLSGVFYLGLGIYSLVEIFKETSNSNGGGSGLISNDIKKYLFLIVGIGLAIKAIYQFVKAYKGDFLEKFNLKSMNSEKRRKTIKTVAYLGMFARGIVVGIVSYFFINTFISGNSGEFKGTSEALSLIKENTSSPWLFVLITVGLICYGIYMFTLAKYRSFKA